MQHHPRHYNKNAGLLDKLPQNYRIIGKNTSIFHYSSNRQKDFYLIGSIVITDSNKITTYWYFVKCHNGVQPFRNRFCFFRERVLRFPRPHAWHTDVPAWCGGEKWREVGHGHTSRIVPQKTYPRRLSDSTG